MGFLQRMGLAPTSKSIQIDSMDNDLRNGLKNMFVIYATKPIYANYPSWQDHFNNRFWMDYFKLTVDTFQFSDMKKRINYIFENGKWYEVYALVEFTAEILSQLPLSASDYTMNCNKVMEREFSGYRFIGNVIAPITNDNEVKEIDLAITNSKQSVLMKGVNIHLEDALRKLSDKKSPDYRNSIKESISGIESVVKVIAGNNGTLVDAFKTVKGKIKIHSQLEAGFKNLYYYTSDSDGIRHALMEDSNCDFEDAKYMLVSSSAFINYLIVKADKAGIKLK